MNATPSEPEPPRAGSTVSPHARDLGRFRSPQVERTYRAAYGDVLTLWPVPFNAFTVSTPFAETHVIVSGPEAGPPLVLLHATGMSSTVWFPNAGDLSRTHRTFAVDVVNEPGRTGQTRLLRGPADCATWLLAVLDELHIARATLIGSSYGGWLAINLALHAPQRVEKLVLLAPAASLLPFTLSTYLLLRLLPYAPVKPGAKRILPMYLPGFEIDPRFVRQLDLGVRGFRYANPRKSIFPRPYTDDQLRAVSASTLLLIGDRERIYDPYKALERAARLVPTIETELIPGAGHILAMQQPHTVDQRVLAFLQSGTP
jgi:pimeloyl-ACP methyl ester carboxylesterase